LLVFNLRRGRHIDACQYTPGKGAVQAL
jgi:hypothetical protein